MTLRSGACRISLPRMTDLSRFLHGAFAFFFLIMLPLLFYLKRRGVANKRIVPYFFTVYALWYLPYAPIHEGCHFLAGRLSGMHASSYQLMPHFWGGDFVNGYINWSNGKPWQILLSCQAPYAIDGLIVLLGYFLFRKGNYFGPLLGAIILTEVFLRSVFDVAVNYFAGTLVGAGDFHYLLGGYSPLAVHAGAWAVMLLGACGALREMLKTSVGTQNAANFQFRS